MRGAGGGGGAVLVVLHGGRQDHGQLGEDVALLLLRHGGMGRHGRVGRGGRGVVVVGVAGGGRVADGAGRGVARAGGGMAAAARAYGWDEVGRGGGGVRVDLLRRMTTNSLLLLSLVEIREHMK